jgi:hypothetical protein
MKKIFIEGLPGAGKTTLTTLLRKEGFPVAPDFGLANHSSDYPGDGTTIEEILAIDDWFIVKESVRMRSEAGIFDRSYLGNLAYAYAYGHNMKINSLKFTIKKYEQAIKLGKLALPEGVVYIDIDPELSIERQYRRVYEGRHLLEEFWRDKFFLQDTRDAYQALFESCTDIIVLPLDGETENTILSESIGSFFCTLENITSSSLKPQIQLDKYIASLNTFHDI